MEIRIVLISMQIILNTNRVKQSDLDKFTKNVVSSAEMIQSLRHICDLFFLLKLMCNHTGKTV